MATNFPTSLDSFTDPAATDPLNSPSHAGQHVDKNDAVEALEAKVGVNGSAVTTSLDYQMENHAHTSGTDDGATLVNDITRGAIATAPNTQTITSTGDFALTPTDAQTEVVRWNGASAGTIIGIVSTTAQRILIVRNITTNQTLNLSNEDTGHATAAERLQVPDQATDFVVGPRQQVLLMYVETTARWCVIALGGYTSTPAAVSTSGSAGTAGLLPARGDHVHAHEAAHIAHDTIFDAKGDIVAASAADTAARLAVGTDGQVLTADSAEATGLKWAAGSGHPDVQTFTADGTWTKPSGVTWVEVMAIGAGGGGGGGRRSNAGVGNARGGGGGAGGAFARTVFPAASLGATEAVVVGVGGPGGAGKAGTANGDNGTAGEDSTFGGTDVVAKGGNAGAGGQAAAGGNGGQGQSGSSFGGGRGSNGGAGSDANPGNDGTDVFDWGGSAPGAAAGGGGGGGPTAGANRVGGVGGDDYDLAGGTAGNATTPAAGGTGGSKGANIPSPGAGGGGGGGSQGGNGTNGGAGGSYGGGGGGGGGSEGGTSGTGGAGADGIVVVVSW